MVKYSYLHISALVDVLFFVFLDNSESLTERPQYRAARTAKKSLTGLGTVLAKTLCQKEFHGPRPLILPTVLCCVAVFGVVLEQEGVFGGWVAVWCQHANE